METQCEDESSQMSHNRILMCVCVGGGGGGGEFTLNVQDELSSISTLFLMSRAKQLNDCQPVIAN